MGRNFNSVAEYRLALKDAIDDTMQKEITSKAQEAMQEAMDQYVYSYPPAYTGRPDTVQSPRKDAGGMRDKANLSPTYLPEVKTLIIEANAPWQNVGYRITDGYGTRDMDLSDAVEQWDMYGAGERPFAKQAEDKYEQRFDKDLQHGIIKRGL